TEVVADTGDERNDQDENQHHGPPAAGTVLVFRFRCRGPGGRLCFVVATIVVKGLVGRVGVVRRIVLDRVHLGGVAARAQSLRTSGGGVVALVDAFPPLVGRTDHLEVGGGALAVGLGLDDIGDHGGDVVRASAADGQFDELLGGGTWFGLGRECFVDGLLADHPGQAVGAEQVAVADLGLAVGHVRVDGTLAVESTQDQGPLRVCGRSEERRGGKGGGAGGA